MDTNLASHSGRHLHKRLTILVTVVSAVCACCCDNPAEKPYFKWACAQPEGKLLALSGSNTVLLEAQTGKTVATFSESGELTCLPDGGVAVDYGKGELWLPQGTRTQLRYKPHQRVNSKGDIVTYWPGYYESPAVPPYIEIISAATGVERHTQLSGANFGHPSVGGLGIRSRKIRELDTGQLLVAFAQELATSYGSLGLFLLDPYSAVATPWCPPLPVTGIPRSAVSDPSGQFVVLEPAEQTESSYVLLVVDRGAPRERLRIPVSYSFQTTPLVLSNNGDLVARAWAATGVRGFEVVDLKAGKRLWSQVVGTVVEELLFLADDSVVAVTADRNVWCKQGRTGALLWQTTVPR